MTLAQTLLTRDLHCELKAHLRRPTLLPTQGLGEPLLGGEFSGFLDSADFALDGRRYS